MLAPVPMILVDLTVASAAALIPHLFPVQRSQESHFEEEEQIFLAGCGVLPMSYTTLTT